MAITRIEDIITLIKQFEQEKAAIDREIEKLKIELADIILREPDSDTVPVHPDCVILVYVEFKKGGKVYDYLWEGDRDIKVGDTVKVETRGGHMTVVTVVDITEVPIDQFRPEAFKPAFPL